VPVFAVELYDVVKALHIMAVVGAFGLPLAYPLLLPYLQRTHPDSLSAVHEVQLWLNQRITGTGTGLILVLGIYLATKGHYWSEVWVTVPLIILLIIGGIGGALINPSVKRMITLGRNPESAEYVAEYQRYIRFEILLGALVLVAIFFMAAKP
jgi:uncharacterized membrane protein